MEKSLSVKKSLIYDFRAGFFFVELKGKSHEPSRAELKIIQLELWLEPARLGLITSMYLGSFTLPTSKQS